MAKITKPGFMPSITPSTQWDGSAGSGFTIMPQDPPRETAKPALRMLVPPRQRFTDELVIGVFAAANEQGTLVHDFGIAALRVHCEGEVVEIDRPGFHTFADANGSPVTYYGWWARLPHPGQDGEMQVYFEAVPRDDTMQSRVIGPYSYFPADRLYDGMLEVAATATEVAGTRYRTLLPALRYCRDQGWQNPLISFSEPGEYELHSSGFGAFYCPSGYVNIMASVPGVRFVGSSINPAVNVMSKVEPVRFFGGNITFDVEWLISIDNQGNGNDHWFDGINAVHPGGPQALWFGGNRPGGSFARGRAYFTECSFTSVPENCDGASLVRGCRDNDSYYDFAAGALCLVGNEVRNRDSTFWNTPELALTIGYDTANGNGLSASVEQAGSYLSDRQWTFRVDGVEVGTFTIMQDWLAEAGGQYWPSDLVDFVRDVLAVADPGWSATLVDNRRKAGQLGLVDGHGTSFVEQDVTDTSLPLYVEFDVHQDFFQQPAGQFVENIVIFDNRTYNFNGQNLFLAGKSAGSLSDCVVANNLFHYPATGPGHVSQVNDNPKSHIVIVHNSWCDQLLWLRGEATYDDYCLVANNVAKQIRNHGAFPNIRDNHIYSGYQAPADSTGTTIGGSASTLFVDAAEGDLTPAGELLENPKQAVISMTSFDQARAVTTSPVGRISLY